MISNDSPKLKMPNQEEAEQARCGKLAHSETAQREWGPLRHSTPLLNSQQQQSLTRLIEKSIIIHKDENGFGLRIKGQSPVFIEHVHENGAAWRAGVRALDTICKVNGVPVMQMDHKEVVLLFKSCSRFVALTLMSPPGGEILHQHEHQWGAATAPCMSRQASTYSQRVYEFFNRPEAGSNLTSRRQSAASTSAQFAPTGTFMDRTNSCRSSASLLAHQQQTKLSRQDSVEDPAGKQAADKRLAICICCRNSVEGDPQLQLQQAQGQSQQPTMTTCSQCQLKYRTTMSHELAFRQLNSGVGMPSASLRQSPTRSPGSLLARVGKLKGEPMSPVKGPQEHQQQQNSNIRGGAKLPASASIKSLPAKTTGRNSSSTPATASAEATRPSLSVANKPQVNKRIEIIREFIDTERTHTERLRCLDELFYRPLKEAGFVSNEQLRMVFSSHRTLYKIHKQIYRILMSANYDVYSEPLVGSALLEIFEGDLKRRLERASCSFCSAQATNIELLNKLTRRDTKAGDFLAQITSQRMVGRLGIKDLLASCFQRLTKYPLLLENLLKATPASLQDDDELEDELERGRVSGHRRRSKSGLSAQQRRSRMRAGLEGDSCDDNDHDDDDTAGDQDEDDDFEDAETEEDEDEEARQARLGAAEEARRNSRRIMAISLAEEREFIERALAQSRQILVRVNESIRVSIARNRLKEIWKRTDKYPGVPLIDITKQQVVHEGPLTLRLSKRSFDVYVLLLNDYIIILTREGQDKYRLKFFTPEGKSTAAAAALASSVAAAAASSTTSNSTSASSGFMSIGQSTHTSDSKNGTTATTSNATTSNSSSNNNSSTGFNSAASTNLTTPLQTVYSPVFVIDEHLTTRDAATDENGFYLLCKRKDDSRIYEFASRSPAERMKWRDKIQWTIERQMGRSQRRPSCESTITKSSSEISANGLPGAPDAAKAQQEGNKQNNDSDRNKLASTKPAEGTRTRPPGGRPPTPSSAEPTKIVGTISYVIDDGIVLPSKMESSRVFVDQAIQVNILDGSTAATIRGGQQQAAAVVASPVVK